MCTTKLYFSFGLFNSNSRISSSSSCLFSRFRISTVRCENAPPLTPGSIARTSSSFGSGTLEDLRFSRSSSFCLYLRESKDLSRPRLERCLARNGFLWRSFVVILFPSTWTVVVCSLRWGKRGGAFEFKGRGASPPPPYALTSSSFRSLPSPPPYQ